MAFEETDPRPFSEKGFYLAEFRDRTLAVALADVPAERFSALDAVGRELDENGTRILFVGTRRGELEELAGSLPVDPESPAWEGQLWRRLRRGPRAAVVASEETSLAAIAAAVALRLRLAKLIWLDERGYLEHPPGHRMAFVSRDGLRELESRGDHADLPLLCEVGRLLDAGFPSVTLCSVEGLEDELFTYAGSGTLFARERYAEVRRLGLDEYEAAHDLIRRGVEEGYLLPRGELELAHVLASSFGVFVEGRFLAGIGALVLRAGSGAGELASLYTLTRFIGDGVGGLLIRFALDEARRLGLRYLFACTRSARVVSFFERHGFRVAREDEIPPEKWQGYEPERRKQVRCLRLDIERCAPT